MPLPIKLSKLKACLAQQNFILLVANSGYCNIGQEAVVQQLVTDFKELNPALKIYVTSFCPQRSSEYFAGGDIMFLKFRSYNFWNLFFKSKYIIIAGDELNSQTLDMLYPYWWQWGNGKRRVLLALLSVLFFKKIVFYKVGLYSVQKWFPTLILRFCLKYASYISGRDKFTSLALRKIYKKAVVAIDDEMTSFRKFFVPREGRDSRYVGLALRYPYDHRFVEVINAIIEGLDPSRIIVFCFSHHPNLVKERDIEFARKFDAIRAARFVDANASLLTVQTEMLKCREIIAMRYHAAIFARALNIPVKIISHEVKMVRAFLENDYNDDVITV